MSGYERQADFDRDSGADEKERERRAVGDIREQAHKVLSEAKSRAGDDEWIARIATRLGMGSVTVQQLRDFSRILLSGK